MDRGRTAGLSARAIAAAAVVAIVVAGCGKKGAPRAPLRLVPEAVSDVKLRRTGSGVALQFVLPTKNLNGPGPIDLARIEVYAMTVAPGVTPPNRELLSSARAVGTIAVKPPPVEGEAQPDGAPADTRPGPGDRVTFDEELSAQKMQVEWTPPPAPRPSATPRAPTPGATTVGSAEAGVSNPPRVEAGVPQTIPTATPAATYPMRIYAIRGISRGGHAGQPSARLTLPIVAPPEPPVGVAATFTERAVTLDWLPAVAEIGAPAVAFNVYGGEAEAAPLNASPLPKPSYEHAGVEFGKKECFTVRSVIVMQAVQIESDAAAPVCVDPKDIFPPAAPKNLNAVPGPSAISLIWDANTESDLAGYMVLRAEAPGATLQPITPQPIRETGYDDKTVRSGVRYVYAVVAVDRAGNASQPSPRIEETAR